MGNCCHDVRVADARGINQGPGARSPDGVGWLPRQAVTLLLFVLAVVALAGCGDDKDSGDSDRSRRADKPNSEPEVGAGETAGGEAAADGSRRAVTSCLREAGWNRTMSIPGSALAGAAKGRSTPLAGAAMLADEQGQAATLYFFESTSALRRYSKVIGALNRPHEVFGSVLVEYARTPARDLRDDVDDCLPGAPAAGTLVKEDPQRRRMAASAARAAASCLQKSGYQGTKSGSRPSQSPRKEIDLSVSESTGIEGGYAAQLSVRRRGSRDVARSASVMYLESPAAARRLFEQAGGGTGAGFPKQVLGSALVQYNRPSGGERRRLDRELRKDIAACLSR